MRTANYLNTSWGHARSIALTGDTWLLLGLIIHIVGYQYTLLHMTDQFWFICSAVAILFYAVAFNLKAITTYSKILSAVFVGLAFNNVVKELFGLPTQFNIYDYYGAAVTVALVIYSQIKKGSRGDGSTGNNRR